MDLVRVEGEERLINVEEALGRDASSVFPTESKKQGFLDKEAAKEALGAVKFVTETELLEIKAQRGERPEDGTMTVSKTLAEVLEENKAAKEEKFQEVWKSMKVGKNRALDEEELEFLDGVYDMEHASEQAKQKEEQQELNAFRLAQLEAEAAKAKEAEEVAAPIIAPPKPAPKPQQKKKPPILRPIIKAKRPGASAADDKRPPKREKTVGEEEEEEDKAGGGLAGLMADYGSGSDDDSSSS